MENVENSMKLATTKKFGSLDVQVYENPEKEFFMTREQIGAALEYGSPTKAIDNIHQRNKDRLDPLSSTLKLRVSEKNRTNTREFVMYNLRGVMEICRFSRQPKADKFMDFCWDVMTALMRGETVSLKSSVAEVRQARFDQMTQTLAEIQGKMDNLEEKRRQDREALDNVLFVCKQLVQTVQNMKQPQQSQQPQQPGSYTSRKPPQVTTYKGISEWRTELYDIVHQISRLTGFSFKEVLKQQYDELHRVYGWYFKDERKSYILKTGYKGKVSDISGVDVIEDSPMYKSIYLAKMKDRLDEEKTAAEVKRNAKPGWPPVIPKDMIPTRHPIEEVEEEETPVIVAEAHAVEVEEPTPKKRYKNPSITLPIVKPIAEKLGDKTVGYRITYAKIYNVIGVQKMDRLRRQYIKTHNRPPKCNPDLFQDSEKALKLFEEAARIVSNMY